MEEAIDALADGETVAVGIGTANERPFIHQFSVGFQARAIQLRDKMKFGSRYGKMFASLKAIALVVGSPPSFEAHIRGEVEENLPRRLSALAVSNNIFGEGHIPYADKLDAGKLGIYCTDPVTSLEAVQLAKNIMLGRWSDEQAITTAEATDLTIHFPKRRRNSKALIDGELIDWKSEVEVKIHPGGLNVLVPDFATDVITV